MYRKAVRTFRAIELLKPEGLIEESWILLRVLLETHVNILTWLKESKDAVDLVQRYSDASALDKLKHLREVNFYEGLPNLEDMTRREVWEKKELGIKSRRTPQEIIALKKHGFSGKSFQERAKEVGLETMYTACYRIASRSVHLFGPAET
jgi:hypothetical protein